MTKEEQQSKNNPFDLSSPVPEGYKITSANTYYPDTAQDTVQISTPLSPAEEILYPDKHGELITKWDNEEIDLHSIIQECFHFAKHQSYQKGREEERIRIRKAIEKLDTFCRHKNTLYPEGNERFNMDDMVLLPEVEALVISDSSESK